MLQSAALSSVGKSSTISYPLSLASTFLVVLAKPSELSSSISSNACVAFRNLDGSSCPCGTGGSIVSVSLEPALSLTLKALSSSSWIGLRDEDKCLVFYC